MNDLNDNSSKTSSVANVDTIVEMKKMQNAVAIAVSESVNVLEQTLTKITEHISSISMAIQEASVIADRRNTDLAASVEHLGKTVALSAFRTQEVSEKFEEESDKAAARARVLQESLFSTFVLQRHELCSVDVQMLKQLRVCLETLMTPVELLLKHNDADFEPRTYDEKRWNEIISLEKKIEQFNQENIDGDIPASSDLIDLALVGIEAVIVDEDGIVGCCPTVCTSECRDQAVLLLSDPATQAVRAQVPGTLQNQRMQDEDDGEANSTSKGVEQPQLTTAQRMEDGGSLL